MRRLSTLTVLAIFAPAMALLLTAIYTVLEVLHVHNRNAKYRSGLPAPVVRAMTAEQDAAIDYMMQHGVTPSEYALRARMGRL